MIKKGIFLLLLVAVSLSEDYYKLLGVQKTASDQEIKRAFKKLSLKYHPDKNKNNKEQAKNQFAKIVNAYETLKDKEKRKIYDKHGEEGVKRHAQGQNPDAGANFGGGFGDFGGFEDFFGGGGGGQHFEFHFGGGGGGGGGKKRQRFFEEEEEEKKKFFKDNTDIVMIDIGTLRKFYRRDQVWIILLYKPKQQKSIDLKEVWEELAAKYYGIFQIAAVDCENDAEICEDEFNVTKTPEIQIIKSNLDSEAYIYEDKNMEVNRIAGFAVRFMENYVNYVSDKNFEDFMKQDQEKNKVILFTAKKSTPPLLRAISKELKGKLVFGEVRQDQKELLKKFKISKFPTLKVITNPLEYQGVDYEGDYKKDQIMKFLREYAYQTRSQSKKQNSQDKQFIEIDNDKLYQGYLGTGDSNLGVILYGRNQDLKYILGKLNDLPKLYKDDPVNFYYVNNQKYDLSEVFQYDASSVALIVTKTKRNRYFLYDQSVILNKNVIQNLLDDVIGGNGRFQIMKGTLKDRMKVAQDMRKTDL